MTHIFNQALIAENSLKNQAEVNNELVWGRLRLSLSEHSLYLDGQHIPVTKTEFKFLQLLMENPRRVFSRAQVLQAIDVLPGIGTNHLIDTHASRIRRKILEAGGPQVINVIRSVGFRLADPALYAFANGNKMVDGVDLTKRN